MGEKIKDLGNIKLFDKNFIIELNKATVKGGPRYIHVQNQNGRYQMTEQEFINFVCMANKAKAQLKHIKNMEK